MLQVVVTVAHNNKLPQPTNGVAAAVVAHAFVCVLNNENDGRCGVSVMWLKQKMCVCVCVCVCFVLCVVRCNKIIHVKSMSSNKTLPLLGIPKPATL